MQRRVLFKRPCGDQRSVVGVSQPALGIAADTGPWLMPAQYERKARAAGNAIVSLWLIKLSGEWFLRVCSRDSTTHQPTNSPHPFNFSTIPVLRRQ